MISVTCRPMSFGPTRVVVRVHDVELKLSDAEAQKLADALADAGYNSPGLLVDARGQVVED